MKTDARFAQMLLGICRPPYAVREAWFPLWPSGRTRASANQRRAAAREEQGAGAERGVTLVWSGSVSVPGGSVSVSGSCRGCSGSIKVRVALRRRARFRPLLLLLRPAAPVLVLVINPRTNGATSTRRGWSARRRRPKIWTDPVSTRTEPRFWRDARRFIHYNGGVEMSQAYEGY